MKANALSSKTLIFLALAGGPKKSVETGPLPPLFPASADSKGFSMPKIYFFHLRNHAPDSLAALGRRKSVAKGLFSVARGQLAKGRRRGRGRANSIRRPGKREFFHLRQRNEDMRQ